MDQIFNQVVTAFKNVNSIGAIDKPTLKEGPKYTDQFKNAFQSETRLHMLRSNLLINDLLS